MDTVQFRWIPSHSEVKGNELADKIAKEATGWWQFRGHRGRTREIMTTATAPRMRLQLAIKSRIRQIMNARWRQHWQTSPHGRVLYKVRTTQQSRSRKSRALSAVIIQMRTGKIGLRHYLYQRGVPDIPDENCCCGRATQTVQHVRLACPPT